jgi:hypothetical protein
MHAAGKAIPMILKAPVEGIWLVPRKLVITLLIDAAIAKEFRFSSII